MVRRFLSPHLLLEHHHSALPFWPQSSRHYNRMFLGLHIEWSHGALERALKVLQVKVRGGHHVGHHVGHHDVSTRMLSWRVISSQRICQGR